MIQIKKIIASTSLKSLLTIAIYCKNKHNIQKNQYYAHNLLKKHTKDKNMRCLNSWMPRHKYRNTYIRHTAAANV